MTTPRTLVGKTVPAIMVENAGICGCTIERDWLRERIA